MVWCLSKSYSHKNNCKKQLVGGGGKGKKSNGTVGTNVRSRIFNAGLLARNQFASRRSCDWPTRLRFSMVFLGPRANAELVSKFHVAMHALHAALPMVTLKLSLLTNVTLGWTTLFMGDMGDGTLHEEQRKNLSNREN
jgi:hypothetical protein